jgi:hypothetical protein
MQGRDKEKQSPFGPYRPKREESPFGPRPKHQPPRNPFEPPDAKRKPSTRRKRPQAPERPLDLYVEVVPGGACFGHLPRLPGLCFRAGDSAQLARVAVAKVVEYLRWLADENLAELAPITATLLKLVDAGYASEIKVAERERLDGAPVWISGNPAALFRVDRYALTDDEVRAHLRFFRQVVRRIRVLIAGLGPKQRVWKPAPDRRSLDETLTHIANTAWWYCSRIDESLPEPEILPEEQPVERVGRLIEQASDLLLAVPLSRRVEIHVPRRFPTSDPEEAWSHAKVCRRQAEHLWEHLQGLPRAVQMAADA